MDSLNQWEADVHRTPQLACWWKRLLGCRPPSPDTLGRVFALMDVEPLRNCLADMAMRMKRMKVLTQAKVAGLFVVAFDGHETFSSYRRCCPECLRRQLTVNDKTQTQYFHRIVTCQLVCCGKVRLVLDQERLRPGEDELAAAKRLFVRVVTRLPRFFDVVVGDALYADSEFFRLVAEHNKYVVAVLKDNHPNAVREVHDATRHKPSRQLRLSDKRTAQVWDLPRLLEWTPLPGLPLRVVRSRETVQQRQRVAGQWQRRETTQEWMWATNLPDHVRPADVIKIGHARWGIENEGFNELVNHWGMDHCFRHDPNALDAFLLTLLLVYALFHVFWLRNVKPQARRRHTYHSLVSCLRESRWDSDAHDTS